MQGTDFVYLLARMVEDYFTEVRQNPEDHQKYHLRRNGRWIRENIQSTACHRPLEDAAAEVEGILENLIEKGRKLKNEIHELCETERDRLAWRRHTKNMHFAKEAVSKLRIFLEDDDISQAYCKLMECLNFLPSLIRAKKTKFRSLHLCEAPGQFILALDHFLGTFHPRVDWHWDANTLNPHSESTSPDDMFLDDKLICAHPSNWNFGASGTGDIFEWDRITMSRNSGYNLATADGSLYTRDNPAEQENLVLKLLQREAEIALSVLEPGGSFIMKIYSMHEKTTRQMIRKIARKFDEVVIYKPLCSKPRTPERYLLCTGYTKRVASEPNETIINTLLLEAEIYFAQLQCHSIRCCLDYFGMTTAEINKSLGKLKNRTVKAVMRKIRADFVEDRYRYSFLNKRREFPWLRMYGNNYIEELKKIDTKEAAEQFIRKTLMQESLRGEEQNEDEEIEWGEVFLDFLTNSEEENFDEVLFYGKTSKTIRHSIFLPPLWLRSMLKVEAEALVDICQPSTSKVLKTSYDEQKRELVVDCSSISTKLDWISLLKDIHFASQKLDSLTLNWNGGTGLPAILSRFSASVITVLSIFFFKIHFGEGDRIVTFSQPHYEEDVPEEIRAFLERLQVVSKDNVVQFVPFQMMAELHPEIEAFNRRQWKKYFREKYPH